MVASGRKRPPRYTLDVHFTSEREKEAFTERLKTVRQLQQVVVLLTTAACRTRSLTLLRVQVPPNSLLVDPPLGHLCAIMVSIHRQ